MNTFYGCSYIYAKASAIKYNRNGCTHAHNGQTYIMLHLINDGFHISHEDYKNARKKYTDWSKIGEEISEHGKY